MKFIAESQSASAITHEMAYAAAWEALIAVGVGGAKIFPVVIGHGSQSLNRFTVKAAATAEMAGLKVGSYWPANARAGLPRHNSLILLFDQDVGRIDTVMEAGVVNAYRTAAADAVAATYLSRDDSEVLTIFGAGNQARYEVEALVRIRPIRTVLVVARETAKAESFCASVALPGITMRPATARAGCEVADIIVTATPSRAPLFEHGWVRPGTHIASMGSDGIGKQELPPELFTDAGLFCDDPVQSREIGEFQHLQAGLQVTAIGEVLAGRAEGRRGRDEITIFDSSGLSLQDLFIARSLLASIEPSDV